MDKLELFFLPSPGVGHLVPLVELAKLLHEKHHHFSITILLIHLPMPSVESKISSDVESVWAKISSYVESVRASHPDIRFLDLPLIDLPYTNGHGSVTYNSLLIEKHKSNVKEAIKTSQSSSSSTCIAFIVDCLATAMLDVGDELGVPTYINFTSGAACLGFMLYLPTLHVKIPCEFKDYSGKVEVPGMPPFPPVMLPAPMMNKEDEEYAWYVYHGQRFREAKGLIVNTFAELEPKAIKAVAPDFTLLKPNWIPLLGGSRIKIILANGSAFVRVPIKKYAFECMLVASGPILTHLQARSFRVFSSVCDYKSGPSWPSYGREIVDGKCLPDHHFTPRIYPVGPVVPLTDQSQQPQRSELMEWLDQHPPSSVVFLCFGSLGTFSTPQLKEMALGLERSGHRFLWSVKFDSPTDTDLEKVLPDGFLDRTKGRGLVLQSWVPQVAILGHVAVGGFVSHCGWNSTLESLWFGVPILAWPLYAEQRHNAFLLVQDYGLAVELKIDYAKDGWVGAQEVERGVRCLMGESEEGQKVRKRTKEMAEAGKKAVVEGGSSFSAMELLAKKFMM